METKIEDLIEQARTLLGWPSSRKLLILADKFPDEAAWKYALGKLREAKRPNEAYLLACLRTAQQVGRDRHPGGWDWDQTCPYSAGGLFCPGPVGKVAKDCAGEVECSRLGVNIQHLPRLRGMLEMDERWAKK